MIKAENQKKRKPFTAQDTIPYKEIYKDGICRTDDNYYSKMVQFYDINYQLAQNDDKAAIFENYCEFLNSFDSSVEVQITFLNQQVNFDEYAKNIDIPEQDDCFNDIRKEYSDMLKMQLSKGNNGLVKTKYITFSIKADNLRNAKSRLERIEASVLNNFKVMGAMAEPLNGVERLKILHDVMNMDTKESFHFHYGMVAKTGLQTKDFIAPTGFDFRNDSYFRMGQTFGCVSYLQITSPELTDKLLADLLDLEENLIINMHLRPIDPKAAIKSLKSTLSNIQKMKIEEQKKEITGEPKNLEEQAISLVGRDIYEKLVKGYTEKQWGRDCKELPAFIIKRLPVRLTFDNNYFNALYQGIPVGGYTKMVENLLEGIEVRLNEDYLTKKQEYDQLAEKVVYTGAIDAYFDYCLGNLEYRSVRFENEVLDIPNFQGNAAVNYTDRETPWTRIIEHKWFEFGKNEDGNDLPKTVISREYSSEWKPGDEPYYPVNDEKNSNLYREYKKLADAEKKVIFGGRLGEYKYYDMDQVITAALERCEDELG